MTNYKCGHKTDGVIVIDGNVMSMATYFEWSESVGIFGDRSQCWECYCAEMNLRIKDWVEQIQ